MSDPRPTCIACGSTSDQVPLIPFEFQGKSYAVCPQHLPLLIHDPVKLAGKLPGAENLPKHSH